MSLFLQQGYLEGNSIFYVKTLISQAKWMKDVFMEISKDYIINKIKIISLEYYITSVISIETYRPSCLNI